MDVDAEYVPTPKNKKRAVNFLDLPLEIRREIYAWLHLQTPMRQAQLCSWMPNATYGAYYLQAVLLNRLEKNPGLDEQLSCSSSSSISTNSGEDEQEQEVARKSIRLLSPDRPLGCLPSALLRSCRQVYSESRCIPFHENEFVYVTWFSSGLSTAKAFVKGLQPWQRDNMRYVRLELMLGDINCVGASRGRMDDWTELCGFWGNGIRGLRLKIFHHGQTTSAGTLSSKGDNCVMDLVNEANYPWIGSGLKKLRALRDLEVDLREPSLTNEQRLRWCEKLSERLNEERSNEETTCVRVVCVEQVSRLPCRHPS
ncbi:hypothetical protein QBC46DRAFT_59786 [Diplogelasinospora grovesii]|uniref:Uncharacterized protein n=1 Tax=Diplogelasinospora grovesii TaxID=303347 RepID=A0AAN6MX42_9PEZI|nr:hypothetical protein QBC46DRAFT_59786 [Diplogelasinospora grovesii]